MGVEQQHRADPTQQTLWELAAIRQAVVHLAASSRRPPALPAEAIITTTNPFIDLVANEVGLGFASALVENPTPLPVLVAFTRSRAVPGEPSASLVPAMSARMFTRPFMDLSVGIDPALLDADDAFAVPVVRYGDAYPPGLWSLAGAAMASYSQPLVSVTAVAAPLALVQGTQTAFLKAIKANTDVIYLGDSTVTSAGGGNVWTQLDANQGVTVDATRPGWSVVCGSGTQKLAVGGI